MENSKNTDNSYITLRDLWEIFLGNIWLFVVSVIVCLAGAVAYIAITPPLYTRTASILIKDDKKGQSIEGAAFESLGLVQSNTDINNEIHILATSQLMEEVVRRLSLQDSYSLKYKGVRWVDLYHSAPFVVVLDDDLSDRSVSLNLTTDGESQYEISSLTIDGEQIDVSPTYNFGADVSTPYGTLVVDERDNGVVRSSSDHYSFSRGNIPSIAGVYSDALSIKLRDEKSSIIDMSMTLGSRQKSEDILNMLISVYNENWIKDKNLISFSTTNFINDRLSIIATELGVVDESISSYKSENLLPDVGAVAGMNLVSSNEILKRQIELENQLSMAQYILNYIDDKSTTNQLLPINTGIGSSSIDTQIAKYNEVLLQKNALEANSSVNNPVVADLVADLSSMKSVLMLSMRDLINTLGLQIENARKEEIAAQKRLSNNPSQELYLLSTGREQMIKEQLYLYLLQKREENELNQAFTAYNTKVLSFAKGSNIPVAPQRKIILLFGVALGLILPIIFLVIRSSFDTMIKSKKDLEGLNIPLLGSVPRVRRTKSGKIGKRGRRDSATTNPMVLSKGNRDSTNEAFRVIRTNLDFMASSNSGEAQVVQLISLNPGSGKSFITANLGLSMALKDAKVLLIDADIRKATLSRFVNAPQTGISDYLSGKISSVEDLILKDVMYTNLDVLPVGKIPPNPSELLLKPNFEELIAQMRSRYDYIFLDCPPVEIVPDAAIVGKICDTAIFVIRAEMLDKRLLPDIEAIYNSKKYNNMCILLNDVCYSGKGYYGYRRYGYYGYGYGSTSDNKS